VNPAIERVPVAPSSWRETAAVLALFALLLSLVTEFLPMQSGGFGAIAADPASICVPGGAPAGDHDRAPSGTHHTCSCCLAQPLNWAAIVPAQAVIAAPFFVATAVAIAGDPSPIGARRYTDSRPRAPPFAA
jgi:hypothetical protein